MTIRIFLFLFAFISIPVRVFAAIHITEIAWMGVAGDYGQYGEWVELKNDGDSAVNLSGWKLYGDGGKQLIYTFSKSIPAASYLMAERTTASMTDPVSNIDDEQGTFGGGGFSNSGEDLVLKDANGSVVESLNFASGWPAGDANTKETMQWNGTAWVTGVATPNMATATTIAPLTEPVGGENNTENGNAPTDTHESPKVVVMGETKKKPVRPKPHVELIIPRSLIVHVPYKFNPTVYTENETNPIGVYRWNFGDGTSIASFKAFKPAQHTYQYPGIYTLWFGYFMSEFDEDPLLFASTQVEVGDPDIFVSKLSAEAMQITNNTDAKIDLSLWSIGSAGYRATLPSMTILGPSAQIIVSSSVLGIPLLGDIELFAPDGIKLHPNSTSL